MTEAKALYRSLCAREKTVPLFSRDWWLDMAAGEDNWDVAIVAKGDEIFASMPYVKKQRYGFTTLVQPPLTPNLGPWLRDSEVKTARKLGQQKELLSQLIKNLPPFDHYSQCWDHRQSNWLPFFWHHFKQTTLYTYVLPDLSSEEALWAGLQENVRREIRKAAERFRLRVRTDLGVDDFLNLNHMVFLRQGMKLPYTDAFVRNLDRVCADRKARKIFIAEDEQGRRHASVYLVWDDGSAYYLMGGGDPALRNSGAASLCMWEAVKYASTVAGSFDFEGSMLESVERFFRGFGAVQMPYFSVWKTPSAMLRLYKMARQYRTG